MKLIQSLKFIDDDVKLGLTIGNFDGVHCGHYQLLNKIKDYCKSDRLAFGVMTFIPHPLLILRPQNQFLINDYNERRQLLEDINPDYLIEVSFDRDFSTISAKKFMNEFIFSRPCIKSLFLGHDFTFGSNKEGNFDFANEMCSKKGINVFSFESFSIEETIISSSLIRECLQNGDIVLANNYLGRNFYLSGTVVKGVGRGRQIGFPTANLSFDPHRIVPQKGVYQSLTTCRGIDYPSLTNIGTNPTFDLGKTIHVETHLLDFSKDIYGEDIKISFIKKIRDEKKFNSVDDLVSQLKNDVSKAKSYDFTRINRS